MNNYTTITCYGFTIITCNICYICYICYINIQYSFAYFRKSCTFAAQMCKFRRSSKLTHGKLEPKPLSSFLIVNKVIPDRPPINRDVSIKIQAKQRNSLFYMVFLLKTQKNAHFAKIFSKKFAYIKNKQYFCNRFPSKRTLVFRKVPHLDCSFGLPPTGNEIITIKN